MGSGRQVSITRLIGGIQRFPRLAFRERMNTAIAWLAAALLLLLTAANPGPADADVVRLKNGNTLEGDITAADERQVTIEIPDVGKLVVDRAEIASIEQDADSAGGGEDENAPAPPSQDVQTAAEEELAVFIRPERSVRLWYPKGWQMQERADRHPYTVTASPDTLPPSTDNPTILEVRKYYHASRTTGVKGGTDTQFLEGYLAKFREQGARITDRQETGLQGVPALRVEARAAGAKGASRILLVVAVKRDTLVVLYCQAPVGAFDEQQRFFEAAAERLEPFSTDPVASDNDALDLEGTRFAEQALAAVKTGNVTEAITRLQTALRANPGDTATRIAYSSLQLDLGLQQREPQRSAFLQRADAELHQVSEWLETQANPADAPALAQAYFLLGEVEARGRNNRDKAAAFYRKALSANPQHPGAKRALGR